MKRSARWTILLLPILWLPAAPARGQEPAGPIRPGPGVRPEQKSLPQTAKPLKVHVDEVTLPVSVRDHSGELALNLTENDFHVYDDGAEQKITHFDLGGDPLSVVLVAETSSRIEPLLPAIRRTGIIFAQTVMAQTGDAAVISYDDYIAVRQKFTDDQDGTEKTIEHLKIGTSGARLYDALERAVEILEKQPANRRRGIVVVGEAVDTGSESKLGAVLREAQLSNIAIYSIGLSTASAELRAQPSQAGPQPVGPPGTFPLPPIPGTAQTPQTQQQEMGYGNLIPAIIWLVRTAGNAVGENSLELASVGTGGTFVKTFRERSIEKAMDQIGGELHASYLLAYRPEGDEPYGYHEIKVVVSRPGLKVRTRPGYYLAPPGS